MSNIILTGSLAAARTQVAHNLTVSDKWLIRGLLAIYARQTADEQAADMTTDDNKIGFNGLDAPILSSFAKQVEEWEKTPANRRKYDSPLSPKQIGLARKKMVKYSRQLVLIAREKAATAETVS